KPCLTCFLRNLTKKVVSFPSFIYLLCEDLSVEVKLFDNASNTSENCSTRCAVTLRTFCKYCSCSFVYSSVPGIKRANFFIKLEGVNKNIPIANVDSSKDGIMVAASL